MAPFARQGRHVDLAASRREERQLVFRAIDQPADGTGSGPLHEVLHVALRHPQRLAELRQQLGDVDAKLFNTCADAIVNSALGHLAWLDLPAGSVRLEALLEWDVERL